MQSGDEAADADALPGIDARRRLVEDEQLRVAQHGLRQQGALAHTAGELPQLAVGHVPEVNSF